MNRRLARPARPTRYTHQDQPGQAARTRRTRRADQWGKAPDHADQADYRPPDGPPSRHQPAISMPPQSPPTAPVSRRASRCPSASWQRHSAGPHGGGRAPGWPKPRRDRLRVDRVGTKGCTGQTAPTFERRATRQSPRVPADTRDERRCWLALVAGRRRRLRTGAGMLAADAAARTWLLQLASWTATWPRRTRCAVLHGYETDDADQSMRAGRVRLASWGRRSTRRRRALFPM